MLKALSDVLAQTRLTSFTLSYIITNAKFVFTSRSLSSVITNGVGANTLLLGNQLNPSSAVAQKMTDTLHAELEAHSIYKDEDKINNMLVGPTLPGKKEVILKLVSSSVGIEGSGLSGTLFELQSN